MTWVCTQVLILRIDVVNLLTETDIRDARHASGHTNINAYRCCFYETGRWSCDIFPISFILTENSHTGLLMMGKASFLVQVMYLEIGVDAAGQPLEVMKNLLHEPRVT